MARIPVQPKVASAPGRPMPPAPRVAEEPVQFVIRHRYDCTCGECERERAIMRKRIERERALAAFGEGRC